MSAYRNNMRPRLIVGDHVRITMSPLRRLVTPSGYSSWHQHTAVVGSFFTITHGPFCGQRGATLHLDVGCGIHMPVQFLARTSGPRSVQERS